MQMKNNNLTTMTKKKMRQMRQMLVLANMRGC